MHTNRQLIGSESETGKICEKMGQPNNFQDFTPWHQIWRMEQPADTNRTPSDDPPPPLICKKWLCHRFGLINARGLPVYKRLYTQVLTLEVIQAIGSTPEEIRLPGMKTFTRVQTVALIKILGL